MSKDLARKLKDAREKLGLSQTAAAAAWDIPLGTLRHWEQDGASPRGLALKALDDLLNDVLQGSKSRSQKAKRQS